MMWPLKALEALNQRRSATLPLRGMIPYMGCSAGSQA